MATFKTKRWEMVIEFSIKTGAKVESFNGTRFVPNSCTVHIFNREIVSVALDRMDSDGFVEDDPNGPDGAGLSVSFGGGQLAPGYRAELPQVALDALDAAEAELNGGH